MLRWPCPSIDLLERHDNTMRGGGPPGSEWPAMDSLGRCDEGFWQENLDQKRRLGRSEEAQCAF